MSRSSNPLTSLTLIEDRLTALLTRIDSAAGVLSEQAEGELSAAQNGRSGSTTGDSSNAALEQLRQLTELVQRQESTTRENEAAQAEWLVPYQQQLDRIEQRLEELRKTDTGPATFS